MHGKVRLDRKLDMKNSISRKSFLKHSATLFGGALIAPYTSLPALGINGDRKPIRMMFNENPYGPSIIAQRAMKKAFSESNLYTMRKAKAEFIDLIANLNEIKTDQVSIGFGSREILNKAALMNGLDSGEMISPQLTFEAINEYAKNAMNTKIIRAKMDNDMHIDLDRMASNINKNTKMIYVCNPNNPTGLALDSNELESFCLDVSKKILVFVDEAYHEYAVGSGYKSMTHLVNSSNKIIICRTASKVHGLAGLRVGYAISNPTITKRLNSYLNGSLNVVGLRAAIASYGDKNFQSFSIKKNNEARTIVTDHLDKKGIKYLKSHTNFIFLKTGMDIKKFQPAMEKYGVIVGRPFPPYNNWCRLSMAKPEEMKFFNQGLDKVLDI